MMTSLVLAAQILAVTVPDPTAALVSLRPLAMVDQHGVEDTVAAHRGPVVVMVVTAKRLRNLRPWERDLRDRFDALDIVRIADVPEDSTATLEQVSAKLRERVPDDVPVLIDIDRRWAGELGLDTSRPNILVLDRRGVLVAAVQGRHDPELAAEVSAAIESSSDRP